MHHIFMSFYPVHSVGRSISTKRPDGMDGPIREDITHQYKFKEGQFICINYH